MLREVIIPFKGQSPCGDCIDFDTENLQWADLKLDPEKFPEDYAGSLTIRGRYLRTEPGENPYRNYVFQVNSNSTDGQIITQCHVLSITCLDCCGLQAGCPHEIPAEAFTNPNSPTKEEILAWFEENPGEPLDRWYVGGTLNSPDWLIEIKDCGGTPQPIIYQSPTSEGEPDTDTVIQPYVLDGAIVYYQFDATSDFPPAGSELTAPPAGGTLVFESNFQGGLTVNPDGSVTIGDLDTDTTCQITSEVIEDEADPMFGYTIFTETCFDEDGNEISSNVVATIPPSDISQLRDATAQEADDAGFSGAADGCNTYLTHVANGVPKVFPANELLNVQTAQSVTGNSVSGAVQTLIFRGENDQVPLDELRSNDGIAQRVFRALSKDGCEGTDRVIVENKHSNSVRVSKQYGDDTTVIPHRWDKPAEELVGGEAVRNAGEVLHVDTGTYGNWTTTLTGGADFEAGSTIGATNINVDGDFHVEGRPETGDFFVNVGNGDKKFELGNGDRFIYRWNTGDVGNLILQGGNYNRAVIGGSSPARDGSQSFNVRIGNIYGDSNNSGLTVAGGLNDTANPNGNRRRASHGIVTAGDVENANVRIQATEAEVHVGSVWLDTDDTGLGNLGAIWVTQSYGSVYFDRVFNGADKGVNALTIIGASDYKSYGTRLEKTGDYAPTDDPLNLVASQPYTLQVDLQSTHFGEIDRIIQLDNCPAIFLNNQSYDTLKGGVVVSACNLNGYDDGILVHDAGVIHHNSINNVHTFHSYTIRSLNGGKFFTNANGGNQNFLHLRDTYFVDETNTQTNLNLIMPLSGDVNIVAAGTLPPTDTAQGAY